MTAAIPSRVTLTALLRKTRTRIFAVAMSLATFTQVFGQPIITQQPQNQTNLAGTTATFTVGATGAEPLSYQWRSYANATSFTNLPFGTEATLALTNVQPTTRLFAVVVTDSGGSATSSPLASLTVLVPPSITSQPKVQIMTVGATATFTVTAAGTAPLAYEWRFNDANLADKTNRSLSLPNVQLTNAGNYTVVVTNAFGSVTSRVAALMFTTIHRLGGITANPDHSISLNLAGVVPSPFAPYYDLYPLEASMNLVDWSPLATLQRTNDSLDGMSYRDTDAANLRERFYRTPTNFFSTPFPKLSGPYPVGTASRLMTDPSRIRNTTPPTTSFMVTFWYPAEARPGVLPAAYIEKEISELFPQRWSPRAASTVAKFVSHALPGVPLATNQTSYPVLIYSPSYSGRRQNTDKAEELASHGYVVVALDHQTVEASVFPSGQVVYGGATDCDFFTKECLEQNLEIISKNIQFLVDELGRLNTNDALLAGRLDLERLGAFGKSWGNDGMAEFGRIDARCKAVVLLDVGWILEGATNVTQLGLQKPFLSMNSTTNFRPPEPGFHEWLYASLVLFTNAINNAFWLQIQDSTHPTFEDKAALINNPPETGDPTAASRAISQTIRACMLSFFDKYLKNQDDHLLDNPAAVYPNIINFRSK